MRRFSRRVCVPLLFALFFLPSNGEAAPLPTRLQADLLVKVAAYDKGLQARAGDTVRVLVVTKDASDDAWAQSFKTTLGETQLIGGLPHVETMAPYTDPAELVKTLKGGPIAIVVLPVSMSSELDALRAALDGVNVLTVAPDAELVRRGVVLGFELVSGKPKLFFNQGQATRQGIVMSADVMKLMTVFP